MKLVRTFPEARHAVGGRESVLVPTMGALHHGHMSLVAIAGAEVGLVVMSVFVNPLQFDDEADLDRYPRDLDADAEVAADAGVDLLFAPDVSEMYPTQPVARVTVTGVTDEMEGAHRPGHFSGVATVVAKLFAGLQPDVAVFGRKDAQQVAVVRRMAADLSFPVRIVGAPTVREPDGLALSSRNVFLDDADRRRGLRISRGLFAAAVAAGDGERDGAVLEGVVREELSSGGIEPEYVTLADADAARRIDRLDRDAFLAVAARVGPVRLIDNVFLGPDGSADIGVKIESNSGRS